MVDAELGRNRDYVEHPDAYGLLLRTGHDQVAAVAEHPQDPATERTRHGDVTALEGGHRGGTTI